VADGVAPEVPRSELQPLLEWVSAGPSDDVVDLCRWVAWRYAGPWPLVLRSASPPNRVLTTAPEPAVQVSPPAPLPEGLDAARRPGVACVAWPPATGRAEVVAGLMAEEGSTIVVAPDATGIAAVEHALSERGHVCVVLRADQPDAERTRAWDAARAGACVVLGARLAVLAPVPDLTAVVVLDDGDEALKEERVPAWNAREVALERGARAGARVTFVSPAPSVEAVRAADAVLRADRGVERAGWPVLVVVDQRDAAPGRAVLSDELANHARAALERDQRVVCVLNRKGRARLLLCRACDNVARCEVCQAAVVEDDTGFECPRCHATRPAICMHCHATRFVGRRVGVTRMRDELGGLLPRATVTEVTTTSSADALEGDVLVGTESVLHRARAAQLPVGLVAFLDFDQELLAPRYRAAEQALWLLVRGARLVGGRPGTGRLLVQTRVPDHEVLAAAGGADPTLVATAETTRRALLRFPPYGGLAEVSVAAAAVDEAIARLERVPSLTVAGPSGSGPTASALVQAESPEELADGLADVDLAPARAHGRVRVEVDPLRV
jgi:primosomal protein N' (replication factor Y)